jgi:hypothetical protein
MDIHAALDEVAGWCAKTTAAGDPEAIEVECHATVWITIGECAPPWRVRYERGSSAGASSPLAQLRYNAENRSWALHYLERPKGWCDDEDAFRAQDIPTLLEKVNRDRDGLFPRLPPIFWRRAGDG